MKSDVSPPDSRRDSPKSDLLSRGVGFGGVWMPGEFVQVGFGGTSTSERQMHEGVPP